MPNKSNNVKGLKKVISILLLFLVQFNFSQVDDSLIWSYSKLNLFDKAYSVLDSELIKVSDSNDRKKIILKKIQVLSSEGKLDLVFELWESVNTNYLTEDSKFFESFLIRYYFSKNTIQGENFEKGVGKMIDFFRSRGDTSSSYSWELIGLKKSIKYFNTDSLIRVLEIRSKNRDHQINRFFISDILSSLHFQKKNFSKALFNSQLAYAIADSSANIELLVPAMGNFIEILQASGDYKRSFIIQKRLSNVLDSMAKIEKNDIYLAVKYFERVNKLNLTKLKNNNVQINSLKSETQFGNYHFIIISSVIFALLLIFLFLIKLSLGKKINSYEHKIQDMKTEKRILLSDVDTQVQKLNRDFALVADELSNSKRENDELRLRQSDFIKELNVANKILLESLVTSSDEIRNTLRCYYQFSNFSGNSNVFSPILTTIRKLRPGKMFSEKGSLELHGITEKLSWIFSNVVLLQETGSHAILPYLLKLKLAITEKKVKDNYSWLNFIFDGGNILSEQMMKITGLNFISFDVETGDLIFSGINSRVYIVRENEILLSEINANKKNHNSGNFKLLNGDLVYIFYGMEKLIDFQFEKELVSILSVLSADEQLQVLNSDQLEIINENKIGYINVQFYKYS